MLVLAAQPGRLQQHLYSQAGTADKAHLVCVADKRQATLLVTARRWLPSEAILFSGKGIVSYAWTMVSSGCTVPRKKVS
jgi:hypothetical protein